MNYFAHGRHYLEDPYLLAGTAVPDWLNVADRKVRVRAKHAQPWTAHEDGAIAALARGIVKHHTDDDWFHTTRAFVEMSFQFSAELKPILPEEEGHRRGFLGHILVEILLDAELIDETPDQLTAYYQALERADPELIQSGVNRMAPRQTERLALLIRPFIREGFLWDYLEDDKLSHRLNQVLRRVGLPPLPDRFREFLPRARGCVAERKEELLTPSER